MFKGPLLRDVLSRVKAAKMKITVLAIDGYSGWLMPEDVDNSDWILALEEQTACRLGSGSRDRSG